MFNLSHDLFNRKLKYSIIGLLLLCSTSAIAQKATSQSRQNDKQDNFVQLLKRDIDSSYTILGIKDTTFIFDDTKLAKAIYRNNIYSTVSHPIEIGGCDIREIRLNNIETPQLFLTLTKANRIELYNGKSNNYAFLSDTVDWYDMHEMRIENHKIESSLFKNFTVSYNTTGILNISNTCFSEKISMDHSRFQEILLNKSTLSGLHLVDIVVNKSISLTECRLQNDSYISGKIKDILSLTNLTFDNNAILDLRYCRGINDKTNLALQNVPIENLRLDWRNFKLDPATRSDYISCKIIYKRLLENFSKNYQVDSYELADKEYQHYRYLHFKFLGLGWLFDKFVWLWWDYGYGGWQVILWMLLLPFLWALIAYKKYDKLHKFVYHLDNFNPFVTSKNSFKPKRSFINALIYVSVIFFAVSINLNKLYYERRLLLLLFLTIYLNGICCMFFLINYLLKS